MFQGILFLLGGKVWADISIALGGEGWSQKLLVWVGLLPLHHHWHLPQDGAHSADGGCAQIGGSTCSCRSRAWCCRGWSRCICWRASLRWRWLAFTGRISAFTGRISASWPSWTLLPLATGSMPTVLWQISESTCCTSIYSSWSENWKTEAVPHDHSLQICRHGGTCCGGWRWKEQGFSLEKKKCMFKVGTSLSLYIIWRLGNIQKSVDIFCLLINISFSHRILY